MATPDILQYRGRLGQKGLFCENQVTETWYYADAEGTVTNWSPGGPRGLTCRMIQPETRCSLRVDNRGRMHRGL